ncbi:Cell division septal protein FtsQ [Verrucomicrobium sp. GAS474]|uniref:cell division protein FtsQ/DivIB n=1 Tax=Verrucomicrobium sp. GAS474 TaxID=1882831 RepID=UPI00087A7589|nr:FtsQ-type POTRA domain-containing protein [Verrucomicrobium sp. GAS474]SDU28717.1 Cell division septal protein FtsQ [Verrucomicrobium sp. GAS474]
MALRRNRMKKAQANVLFATTTGVRHQRRLWTKRTLLCGAVCLSLTLVGIATHYAAGFLLNQAFYENPRYALKTIVVDVKGGLQRKQVIAASRLFTGRNVMTVDLAEVERNVEKLPYVASAQVRRELPDKIIITVSERMPIARIADELKLPLYVDRDGVTIKPMANEPLRTNLPEIVGTRFTGVEPGQHLDQPEVLAAVQLLKCMELTPVRARLDIARLDVSHPLAIGIETRDGASVLFQLRYLPQQLGRLEEIIDYAESQGQQIASVDLTPERNVPVRFK